MWGWLRGLWGRSRPLGMQGEALAARYLRAQGYRILHQNAQLGRYEIDIIAQEGDTIAFVEVKTRSIADTFMPEDSIGATKMLHIRRAAELYRARQNDPAQYYRFDVVSIVIGDGQDPEITLYRNAF